MRRAVLACVLLALTGCGDDDEEPERPRPAPVRTTPEEPQRTETAQAPARSRGGPRVKTLVEGLDVPWEIAFLPDGRALVTERPGRVRLLSRRFELRDEPVAEVEVNDVGEAGLLGVAVDPRFARNRFVYLYRTTSSGNEVARYRLDGARLREQSTVARGIRAAANHDGGRIHFGPDGRLYFSAGDAGEPDLAQEPGSLNGKILRLDPREYRGRGGRPEAFSLGHRNPQGFDWQPRTRRLVEDEHGPDGDDEVNVLRRGANYGWPLLRGGDSRGGFVAPAAFYPETIAPSGATFVSLPRSEWTGDYLIACLAGEQIRRIGFDGARVTRNEALFEGRFGRLRTVVEGPDGALYALTNNTDGRGIPREGDDRLLRIVPPAA
jgi:glucose/arabinose dehydrogenase